VLLFQCSLMCQDVEQKEMQANLEQKGMQANSEQKDTKATKSGTREFRHPQTRWLAQSRNLDTHRLVSRGIQTPTDSLVGAIEEFRHPQTRRSEQSTSTSALGDPRRPKTDRIETTVVWAWSLDVRSSTVCPVETAPGSESSARGGRALRVKA
jgi:hypothetical protein